jgi:GNAT superfamily N-acetyltransferase
VVHRVVAVPLGHIIDLRVRVLRQGTPVTHCNYPEDALDDVVHLAIDQDGRAVCTSTWFDKQCPHRPGTPAVQLKGMAVDPTVQTAGLGRALVDAGLDLARSRGAHLVWARARDSAIGFYEKCGFEVMGDGFIDEPTAMPHHIVVRDLA